MEKKQTDKQLQSSDLSNIKTGQEALQAITRTYQEAYNDPRATANLIPIVDALLDRLSIRATELGVSQYEIARATLGGLPKNVQQEYFKEWEDANIYNDHKSLTPKELFDLKQEFGL